MADASDLADFTKIERVIFETLSTLVKLKKPPAFKYPKKDQKSDRIINTVVSFGERSQRPLFASLVYVMQIIYLMILDKKTCTVRDVFYNDVKFYESQKILEDLLNRVCFITMLRRSDLPIKASAKGHIAGDLSWTSGDGVRVKLHDFNAKGMLVTTTLLDTHAMKSNAKFILFVEKDAVFQTLLQMKATKMKLGSFVMITGKGYADRLTRRVVNQISRKLAIPVLALVDGDPYGLDIVANLKWGSSAHESISLHADSYEDLIFEEIIPDAYWVGLRPSDYCHDPKVRDKLMPLTESDKKRFRLVQKRARRNGEDSWVREIEIALQYNWKAELEAMCDNLAEILEDKIGRYFSKPHEKLPLQSSQS